MKHIFNVEQQELILDVMRKAEDSALATAAYLTDLYKTHDHDRDIWTARNQVKDIFVELLNFRHDFIETEFKKRSRSRSEDHRQGPKLKLIVNNRMLQPINQND